MEPQLLELSTKYEEGEMAIPSMKEQRQLYKKCINRSIPPQRKVALCLMGIKHEVCMWCKHWAFEEDNPFQVGGVCVVHQQYSLGLFHCRHFRLGPVSRRRHQDCTNWIEG